MSLVQILGWTLVGALVTVLGTWVVRRVHRLAGPFQAICPETKRPVGLRVDPVRAFFAGTARSDLRLLDCTRWPEKRSCGQECLEQIAAAPEACLVRSKLAAWYRSKSCALCQRPFEPMHGWTHEPALLGQDHEVVHWSEVPAATLAETLATHLPVCWDCAVIESLYRQHPELIVERPGRAFH